MPVDIEVTPQPATGPQGLDDVLTAAGGTAEASLIAVPVRRPQLRPFRDPGAGDDTGSGDDACSGDDAGSGSGGQAVGDGNPLGDGWAEVTGTDTSALATAIGLSVPEAVTAFDVSGKPGEVIRTAARTADGVRPLILLGVGDGRPADLRRAGAALARQVEAEAGATALATLPAGTDPDPFVEGVLPDDYTSALTSITADLAHVPSRMNGASNGQAGSIVAALFLREFTGGRRWAHLNIAGAARSGSDDGELTKGGTGFGARLLLHWLAPAAA